MKKFQDLNAGDTIYAYNTTNGDRSECMVFSIEKGGNRVIISSCINSGTPTDILAAPDANLVRAYDTDDIEAYGEDAPLFLIGTDSDVLDHISMPAPEVEEKNMTLAQRIRKMFLL